MLLEPFRLSLSEEQAAQILTYLHLLLRWNRAINLTAMGSPEMCVTRHFGESLYLAKMLNLEGRLLDIGSGAGFPGLALKIVFPSLSVTLLEPIAKKRAFLKEVARALGMNSVEVRSERLEQFATERAKPEFEAATARAVGGLELLIPLAAQCLKPGGHLCLWTSHGQAAEARVTAAPITWAEPIALPLARHRAILVGVRL